MEMFRNMIGQIGVFMICAQAVIHFRPKEAYGKYLRLLLSVMVLVQIFSPVYGLFGGEEGANLAEKVLEFQEEMEAELGEAAERRIISDLQLEDMSLNMLQEIWAQKGYTEAGESSGAEAVERKDTEGTKSAVQDGAGSTDVVVPERVDGVGSTEVAETKKTDRAEVEKVEIRIAPVRVTD